jgi:hypothetical protein
MDANWPFDQERNAAAVTTRQVLREGYPILDVVHYSKSHTWSFSCGTTSDVKDGLVVGMGCIVDMDPTLLSIADLPPAWRAWRQAVGAEWERWKDDEF